ncbi:type IA DNA topoisomerase [Clostridium ganghwense]|uniref:DNA topoisomerase n=1 Tax=Clostridium ganghwense TaxID=312089 RepID=A0ABT4CTQ7_9CLOT|nr:type IA DNA topoisomerase [Clostridium ganghwense]MCY6372303.1 DNA topoisomerase [Clostridium ganghwense]
MGKSLYITEKPSVAMEFVKLLNVKGNKGNGFIEGKNEVFTWCVGHMVTMSYPEAYDEKLKKWALKTIPFLPQEYKYEIISAVAKQFNIVKSLLLREDVDTIYVCTDSGREGEYIYRLVDMMVGVKDKMKKRVWIDSQTEEEIKRGIREAKPLSEYDALSDSAYLRAKEDYLLGINFSRLLTLIYGKTVSNILGKESVVIAVGRVMSCVLGMIVEREMEIRDFIQTSFYKITGEFKIDDTASYDGEWKAVEGSKYLETNLLYNESGFKKIEDAENLISKLKEVAADYVVIQNISKKKENKNPPLLFNLAELQNECSKRFKINPDETLNKIQNLYEKKMLTYPRTDARVLSKAVAKEVHKNIKKLTLLKEDTEISNIAKKILEEKSYKNLEKTKYVNDSKITDHYAIIPTGEGVENYSSLTKLEKDIYNLIVRRFLSIFYPPAKYSKIQVETKIGEESFFTTDKVCIQNGYLDVIKKENSDNVKKKDMTFLNNLKKGQRIKLNSLDIKEGKTSPPKRYTSGSIIIAMENAGKLIEDEELREQIKGSGIGTSATRAEILKKLERIEYIKTNTKTQILTPTLKGEIIYRVIRTSIPSLLNPTLTASWEKGLSMVSERNITSEIFMDKLEGYVKKNVEKVVKHNNVINTEYLISLVKDKKSIDLDESKINEVIGVCPICNNGRVVRNSKGYGCDNWKSGCKFFLGTICEINIPINQIKKLIRYGKTDIINGFKSKKGNLFNARLIINNNKIEFRFE